MPLTDLLILAALGAGVLLLIAALAFVLRLAARDAEDKPAATAAAPRMRPESLRASFRTAVELIESHIAGRRQRYGVPWVLVFDDAGRDDSLGLDHAGIASSLGTDAAAAATTPGLSWHFYDQGVLVRFDGASLGDPQAGPDKPEPTYDEFLGLCRDYRAQRPFDGVVLTVPAALLTADPAEARPALARLAQRAARRMRQAQNRFAMRLTVNVIVSGCEEIPGFAAFARSLPEAMRGSMLGWSVPYDVALGYQPAWVREAVDGVVATVGQTVAELGAEGIGDEAAARELLLLPGRLERLVPALQLYLDELLRPSAYHEPFLWRGLYLTGDASPGAVLQAELAGAADAMAAERGTDADAQDAPDARRIRQPSFLRDVFEAKVFPERGLTRPSGSRTVEQPALHRGLRWAGYAFLALWTIGLLAASVSVRGGVAQQRALLDGLRADVGVRAASTDQQRERAIALLRALDRLESDRLWSVFMPGSWPTFDAMHARLREQMGSAFGEIAVTAFERGLQLRAAELTGGALTSTRLDSGGCADAGTLPETASTSLAIETTQEFESLADYVTRIHELADAHDALKRLQGTSAPAASADLSLLVQVALGVTLPDLGERVAQMFRTARVERSPAALDAGWSVAAGCRLKALGARFAEEVLEDNALLRQQRLVSARYAELLTRTGEDPDQLTAGWRELLDEIKTLREMTTAGGAAWMVKPTFLPGPAWTQLLAQIEATPLLGGAVAARQLRESAERGFAALTADMPGANDERATAALSWNDKESRFRLGPDLAALSDGLSQLLARPWMSPRRDRAIPDFGGAPLGWDVARLDQALSTDELEKRFRTEVLQRFPATTQQAVESLARRQLARTTFEQVIDAMSPAGRAPGTTAEPATLEAQRSRLLKAGTMIEGLGGRREAELLRAVVAGDATRRLHDLDDIVDRSEPYTTRNRDFGAWMGDRAPALAAFAVADAGQLSAYLARQRALLESLSREAAHWTSLADSRGESVQRWRAIGGELERARDRNPNSTLSALEAFVVAIGGDIDVGNCAERLGALPVPARGDWFSERHAMLRASVLQRCRVLRTESARQNWAGFATEFNRAYAGRPPFAPAGAGTDMPSMDAGEMASLIQRFDGLMRGLGSAPVPVPAGAAPAAVTVGLTAQAAPAAQSRAQLPVAVRRFVDQLERTRAFLAPMVPGDDGQPSGYDLAVEFRAASSQEAEAQNVIDWSMTVGSNTLGWRDAPRPLRWEPGQPISISVRMAKDGPAAPLADPRQAALRVDAKTATWQWTEAWSLIGLLQRQRDGESGARGDARAQLLRLELPLTIATPTPANGAAPAETRARLFMRVTVTPAGKRTPLTWPGPLPTRAPEWDTPDV